MGGAFDHDLPAALRPSRKPENGEPGGAEPLYRIALVAEIGTGHGGDLPHAFELIDAAAESGADCAKFQLVYADEIIHPMTGAVELPGGSTELYRRFKSVEAPPEFYAAVAQRCSERGLRFLCTAFGPRSARELKALNPVAVKVASPELNYVQLLERLAEFDVPLVLSTGVSRLSDIERAVDIAGAESSVLLHCITAYPAPEEEYNLRTVDTLARAFGTAAGVSDHSADPVLVPALAATCGAAMIEKHFTLSTGGNGLDDRIALEPEPFSRMCATVRRCEEILRIGGSAAPERIREELAAEFSQARVDAVLGDGVKRLAPSEQQSYGRSNRSLHALQQIEPGELIGAEDVALLRTESNLRPGLAPHWLATVIGARATRRVEAGDGITIDDLMERGR